MSSKRKVQFVFTASTLLLVTLLASGALGGGLPAKALRDVDIQLIGVALYKGKSTALIRDRAAGTEQFYEVGDTFREYQVRQIKADCVEFERKDVKYLLYLSTPAALLPPQSVSAGQTQKGSSSAISSSSSQKSSEQRSASASKEPQQKSSSMFVTPMKGKITSGYGYRTHPMGGGRKFHNGVDIAAPHGTPIEAAAAGKVIFAGPKWSLGEVVIIQHRAGYRTIYGHLSKILVKSGERMKQGQVIGREGSTGISTGPHLHFSIMRNGKYVNPSHYLPLEKQ